MQNRQLPRFPIVLCLYPYEFYLNCISHLAGVLGLEVRPLVMDRRCAGPSYLTHVLGRKLEGFIVWSLVRLHSKICSIGLGLSPNENCLEDSGALWRRRLVRLEY